MDAIGDGQTKVFLLGHPRVLHGGDEQALGSDLRHQLLAHLAYDGGWVERVRLAELFWGDSDESTANQNLRQLLQRSRRLPWTTALEADRRHVRWRVWTDVAEVRRALTDGRLAEVEALEHGPLMDGMDSHGSEEFAAWLGFERERSWVAAREGLLRLARERAESGDQLRSAAVLDEILRRDPYDEDAVSIRLETARAGAGATAALRTYRAFSERLQRELGVAPSSATQRLAAVVEKGFVVVPAVAPADPPPAVPAGSQAQFSTDTGTSFVGRHLELALLADRISRQEGRLITVTGPSGIGKTRLARECGRESMERFPDGVYFVPLVNVSEAAGLPSAVAEVFGLRLQGDAQDLNRLGVQLAQKRALLILDNFEHVMDAVPAVTHLLTAAPGLSVLVTSHQRLGLAREWVVPIEGLALPPAGTALSDAMRFDAIDLFAQRARQCDPDFELTSGDLPWVESICRSLDRSPLGIELAAAWTRLLAPKEIAERIRGNLDFLASSAVDVPERHRGLRAAFDYTWALLTTGEREALARLAVFRGGFDHMAAASVAGTPLPLLATLCDKSLLKGEHGRRFFVKPQLRHFLATKLEEFGAEPERMRDAHLRYMIALAESHVARDGGWSGRELSAQLAVESDNILAALEWAASAGRTELGLRLAAPLANFWNGRGSLRQVRDLLDRLLRASEGVPPTSATVRTLAAAGSLSMFLAEFSQAQDYLERGMALTKSVGSPADTARLQVSLGSVALRKGERAKARKLYLTARRLLLEHPDQEAMVGLLNNLGALAVDDGEIREALDWLEEAMTLLHPDADPALAATVLYNAGWAAWHDAQAERAFQLLRRSLEASRSVGALLREAGALNTLALLEIARGDLTAAERDSAEALRLRAQLGDRFGLTFSFDARALLAARQGDVARAAKLLGAVGTLRAQLDAPLGKGWAGAVAESRELAEAALGDEAFRTAFAAGENLRLEAAIDLAAQAS